MADLSVFNLFLGPLLSFTRRYARLFEDVVLQKRGLSQSLDPLHFGCPLESSFLGVNGVKS